MPVQNTLSKMGSRKARSYLKPQLRKIGNISNPNFASRS